MVKIPASLVKYFIAAFFIFLFAVIVAFMLIVSDKGVKFNTTETKQLEITGKH